MAPPSSKGVPFTDRSARNPWHLSPTEFRTVELLMTQESLLAIANMCGVAVSTTETHIFRAYKKMGVKTQGMAASKMTLWLCRSNPGCGHGIDSLPSLDPF